MRKAMFMMLIVMCASAFVFAQSGHWEGSAAVQSHTLAITIDLAQNVTKAWDGDISFPEQKTSAVELSKIVVDGSSVAFESVAVSRFNAAISKDGKSMDGTIQLGRKSWPVHLSRISDQIPRVAVSKTQASKELKGTWEGTVKYGKTYGEMTPPEGITPEGATFDFRFRVTTDAKGYAVGEVSRLDEAYAVLPLDQVTQNGDKVRFEFYGAGIVFEGILHGNEIVGEWRQLGAADVIPLTLKRS
jgi:hypothetical protein